MLNISYTLSPRLKEVLYKIERLRRQILLTPVSPKTKLKLRWEAMLKRIYSSLKLSGNSLKKGEMVKLLAQTHKKIEAEEQEVLKYKAALNYISQNWLGSENPVNSQALIELYRKIGSGRLEIKEKELQYLLDYLQARPTSPATLPDSASLGRRDELPGGRARFENPIIQAGIVNIEIEKMRAFSKDNKLISHLASLLFLYKFGYDFRGFLAYETEWLEDSNNFKENYERAFNSTNLTLWLEYFASCILKQIELVVQSLSKPKPQIFDIRESFWELNDRQKSTLSYLDQPQATITNRQIQKRYKTSQITASRDLAKLVNLGFLFSHGKGRSVYYTKI